MNTLITAFVAEEATACCLLSFGSYLRAGVRRPVDIQPAGGASQGTQVSLHMLPVFFLGHVSKSICLTIIDRRLRTEVPKSASGYSLRRLFHVGGLYIWLERAATESLQLRQPTVMGQRSRSTCVTASRGQVFGTMCTYSASSRQSVFCLHLQHPVVWARESRGPCPTSQAT